MCIHTCVYVCVCVHMSLFAFVFTGQMRVVSSSSQRDLPVRGPVGVRGGRQRQQDLLSEPLSSREALPRPQDSLLRRGTLPLLRSHQKRRTWQPSSGLLLKGMNIPRASKYTCMPDWQCSAGTLSLHMLSAPGSCIGPSKMTEDHCKQVTKIHVKQDG